MNDLGRLLMIAGAALLALGALLLLAPRLPFLGRLPGDLSFERGGLRIDFPLATSIVLSIILTIVLSLLLRR